MATDDHSLVQRARSGDERAFRLLVERYQKKVYAVALGMVKDREEAMDVVQEAFVKVHRSLDSFKADATFYTWLYRITVNVCIDVIRRRGAIAERSVEFDERIGHDLAEANLGGGVLPAREQPRAGRCSSASSGRRSRRPWSRSPRSTAPSSCSASWTGSATRSWRKSSKFLREP